MVFAFVRLGLKTAILIRKVSKCWYSQYLQWHWAPWRWRQ